MLFEITNKTKAQPLKARTMLSEQDNLQLIH